MKPQLRLSLVLDGDDLADLAIEVHDGVNSFSNLVYVWPLDFRDAIEVKIRIGNHRLFLRKGGDELQTDGRRDFGQLILRSQLAGLFVNPKRSHVVGILVGDQQELPFRINAEIARPFATRGFVANQSQFAGVRINRKYDNTVVAAI